MIAEAKGWGICLGAEKGIRMALRIALTEDIQCAWRGNCHRITYRVRRRKAGNERKGGIGRNLSVEEPFPRPDLRRNGFNGGEWNQWMALEKA